MSESLDKFEKRRKNIIEFCEDIIDSAKEHNLFIDYEDITRQYGEGHYNTESRVFIDQKNEKVIKVKDPFKALDMTRNSKYDAILQHIIHNIYFPETNYKLIGITEDSDYVRLVLEQKFIHTLLIPSFEEVDAFLATKGFGVENVSHLYTPDVRIYDAHTNNAIMGRDEKIYVIDPMFRLFRDGVDIIKDHLDNEYVLREVQTLAPVIPELNEILPKEE